jgi:nicotinamide phosphoribosyltransferase
MRLWYPITVATLSWHAKRNILDLLTRTADDPKTEIPFKLHDFGARGVSSSESAAIGGAAHLVNFMGSDTIEGIVMANRYYDAGMAGFSIPAAEHSTITSWGRDREAEAYSNMLDQFAKPGGLVAIVSDSYNLWNALENIWGTQLKQRVVECGATVVLRPDSGNPIEVVLRALQILDQKFGSTINDKGYKVLNHVRIIQGDGVTADGIVDILANAARHDYSATNIAFGMGGGLLQQVNRDTQRMAYKCSAVQIDGEWYEVSKDPITDPGKKSKGGRLTLVREGNKFKTIRQPIGWRDDQIEVLRPVFRNGEILETQHFADIRERAEQGLNG